MFLFSNTPAATFPTVRSRGRAAEVHGWCSGEVLSGKFKQFGLGGSFLNPGEFLPVLEEPGFGSSTGSAGGLVKNSKFSHPNSLSALQLLYNNLLEGKTPWIIAPAVV